MDKLAELVDLVKKCRDNCPWCKEQTFESYLQQVLSEAVELEEAVESGNKEFISEEMGDLLWDVVMLLHLGEHKGLFDKNLVIDAVNKKILRRKPYLESGEQVTIEEAMRIWKEEKAKEKKK